MKKRAVLLALALSACDKPVTQSELQELHTSVAQQNMKIGELQGQIYQLQSEDKRQLALMGDVVGEAAYAKSLSISVSKGLSESAKVANHNALLDMNRRGACGYRTVNLYNDQGTWTGTRSEKILCTEKDLAK